MRTLALITAILLSPAAALAGGHAWELVDDNYAGVATDQWSVPALVDIDADGDYDLFVGNDDAIAFYRNDGTPQVPSWTLVSDSYGGFVIPGGIGSAAFVDLDADGDFDLFTTGNNPYFYRNDGTPSVAQWTLVTQTFIPPESWPPLGCSHISTFVDLDGDNDLDYFLDNCDWIAIYYENQGSSTSYQFDFSWRSDPWDADTHSYIFQETGLDYFGNYLAFEDVDEDGDLDMIASDTKTLAFLKNVGDRFSPVWEVAAVDYPGIQRPARLSYGYVFPAFVDIDADGQNEVILGDLDGYLSFYEQVPDADLDGVGDAADCGPSDPTVFPGAFEERHDGIDQDCNGHDLTLDVREAGYDAKKDKLTVLVTSGLGAGAQLVLNGFGPMTWTGSLWEYVASGVTYDPRSITVCGVEGCFTASTVTYDYEQHQFAFVDDQGDLLVPPGEENTLEGVRTGDTLHMRFVFTDHGDSTEKSVPLRIKYYTSKDDFFDDVNYRYVIDPMLDGARASDWEWWNGCASGTWCDHRTRLATAVTTDHGPQPGWAFEGNDDRFYWSPTAQNSGCENNLNLRYVGTYPQSVSYWFRYELGGVTMPYSGMHYGGNKGPAVRTIP